MTNILMFEYFTASGEKDKCIISEAEAMIFGLLKDLSDYSIDLVINKSYENIIKEYSNVNPILIDDNIIDWLEDNAANFKKAIFIAAENNNNLYNITKILEDNNVKIYNSSARACFKSSDKFLSYEELYDIVPQPKTTKIKIDSNGSWIESLKKLYEKWKNQIPNLEIILKPLLGVDCENIVIIENINDINRDLEKIFSFESEILVQEYIRGTDVSVSLLSNGQQAIPISLNKQYIELKNDKGTYIGGKIPYYHILKQKAFDIAIKAVEAIEGLRGFVGVDLIITENDVYLLEINSRFTTPYVGLQKIADFNIGKYIINLIDNKINISEMTISLDGEVEFKKSGDNLIIR